MADGCLRARYETLDQMTHLVAWLWLSHPVHGLARNSPNAVLYPCTFGLASGLLLISNILDYLSNTSYFLHILPVSTTEDSKLSTPAADQSSTCEEPVKLCCWCIISLTLTKLSKELSLNVY